MLNIHDSENKVTTTNTTVIYQVDSQNMLYEDPRSVTILH